VLFLFKRSDDRDRTASIYAYMTNKLWVWRRPPHQWPRAIRARPRDRRDACGRARPGFFRGHPRV